MAIQVGNVSTVLKEASSPFTKAHTVGAGMGRILVVCTGNFNGGIATNTTAVSYNGVALTKVTGDGATERHVDIWVLLNPPVGTYNISVTQTGGGSSGLAAVNFTGAAQEIPAYASTSGTGSTITAEIARCALVAVVKTADNGSTYPTTNSPSVQMYSHGWTDTFQWGMGAGYKLNASGTNSVVFSTNNDAYGAYVISIAPLSNAALLMGLL